MALVYHMNAFSQSRIPIKYDLLQRQRHFSTEPSVVSKCYPSALRMNSFASSYQLVNNETAKQSFAILK